MRKLAAFMLILMMTSGAWAQTPATKGASQAFAWRDFKAAFAEAQSSKKMIFVDIYTKW